MQCYACFKAKMQSSLLFECCIRNWVHTRLLPASMFLAFPYDMKLCPFADRLCYPRTAIMEDMIVATKHPQDCCVTQKTYRAHHSQWSFNSFYLWTLRNLPRTETVTLLSYSSDPRHSTFTKLTTANYVFSPPHWSVTHLAHWVIFDYFGIDKPSSPASLSQVSPFLEGDHWLGLFLCFGQRAAAESRFSHRTFSLRGETQQGKGSGHLL